MRKSAIVYATLTSFSFSTLIGPAWADPVDPLPAAESAAESSQNIDAPEEPLQVAAPQSTDAAATTGQSTVPEHGADGQPQTRGLFLLALIPVFAGLVGKVGESLVDALFKPKKPGLTNATSAPKPAVTLDQLSINGNYYAGIAYAPYLVPNNNGEPVRVDAATHQFHTGDQFMVKYVANMPGRIDVSNVNPRGQETRLGTWAVATAHSRPVTLPSTLRMARAMQSPNSTSRKSGRPRWRRACS